MREPHQPSNQTRVVSRLGFLNLATLVGILYFTQDFLVPLVLAALVSFLLDPVNRWIERFGVKHIVAVIVTTTFTFLLIGAVVYLVAVQIIDLAAQLPTYKNNLIEKASALRTAGEGPIGRAVETIREVAATLEQKKTPPATGTPGPEGQQQAPVAVEVVPSTSQAVATATSVVGPVLAPIGTVAMVLLIAIFMMMARDDLRDRVIHLMGRGRLRLTTHALDEAGRRVSQYLLAQLLVNVSYGIPIGVGLYFIGIPNAILWGVFAIVLRFLPYIGPWIAAAFPIVLSIAVSNSWSPFLLTVGLFVAVELISNNVVEPWLYGARTGLSPLAVVVSAVFWTWIWGLPGLLLATPVTVCLVVMGKYVPQLRLLDLLLGDRPPITLADRLYHRLLAREPDEALDLLQSEAEKSESAIAAFDAIALPAARKIECDFRDGLLLEAKRDAALYNLREVVAELGDARQLPPGVRPAVLCIPAGNLADEIGADMLGEALRVEGIASDCLSCSLTSGEAITKAVELEPCVVCISVVAPESFIAATFLCRHLRQRLPESKVMVGLWQPEDEDEYRRRVARLESSGASRVLPSIARIMAAIIELMPADWCHPGPEAPQAPVTAGATA